MPRTLEQAEELVNSLNQKLHYCNDKKQRAQAIAFDATFLNAKPTMAELKADAFNAMTELKKIVEQRDKLKNDIKTLRYDNRALRDAIAALQKEE